MRLVGERLVHGLGLLLALSALAFLFCELAPGDFLTDAALRPDLSADTLVRWRERYGLDGPPLARYGRWMAGVLRGDWGVSLAHNVPVAAILWPRALQTLQLNVAGLGAAWVVALPLAVWSAWRRDGFAGRALDAAMGLLAALPDLLVALGALTLMLWTGWLGADSGLALGALTLAAVSAPVIFRHARAGFLGAFQSPFVAAARARGLRERDVVLLYALPAAANPVLTTLGLSLSTLLSASLVVEVVLSWPGLGPLLVEAVLGRDTHVVLASVMLSAVLLLAGNLAADMLLALTDPRVREG